MSAPVRRVLVSTMGSAGDLFPLLPLVLRMRREGHDVRCAVPRSLSLYLRMVGVPSIALGDGSEMDVVNDLEIFTTRFDGWSSWRRTLDHYVTPTLANDFATIDNIVTSWQPDIVVASGFAAAARLVARRRGLRLLNVSIYPQHDDLTAARGHLGERFTTTAAAIAGLHSNDRAPSTAELLGSPAHVMLHDPALLQTPVTPPIIGFPYWDGTSAGVDDLRLATHRLAGPEPHLIVTLGSFVGLARQEAWRDAAAATAALGMPAVFVGARGRWAAEVFGDRPDILCVGFIPLSEVFPIATAAVHHGGIGTTFAALRAGCPAVVLPQAFDQSHNARMVAAAGIGCDGHDDPLQSALETVLGDRSIRQRTEDLAARLIPVDVAVDQLVELTLGRTAGGVA